MSDLPTEINEVGRRSHLLIPRQKSVPFVPVCCSVIYAPVVIDEIREARRCRYLDGGVL